MRGFKAFGYVLILAGSFFLLYLGLKNVTAPVAATAADDSWEATWTPTFDADYDRAFINTYGATFRTICQNNTISGCPVIDGDLANNHIFSAPPTIVQWDVVGTVSGTGFTETWMAGDGLGPGADFRFQSSARAGETGGRDHAMSYFTGEARLAHDGGERLPGTPLSLTYRWQFASEDGDGLRDCRRLGICARDLRWGEDPNRVFGRNVLNDDRHLYLDTVSRMAPGQAVGWTVTGRIN